MTDICLVVAMADNRVIGRDGGLPWHLSSDLKFFKSVTMGHPVVMGRKTYESIGRPLPGRDNIVITRQAGFSPEGVEVAADLDEAVALGAVRAEARGVDTVMIIGGGQIYAAVLDRADRVTLTEVHTEIDGDTRFPPLPADEWREVSRDDRPPETPDEPALSFVILERRDAPSR